MKRVIVVLFIAFMAYSCGVQRKTVEAYYEPVVLDFTPYIEKGFVFSTSKLEGVSAGVISINYYPKRTIFYKQGPVIDDVTDSGEDRQIKIVSTINSKVSNEDFLNAIYQEAIRLKANAVGELVIKRVTIPHQTYIEVFYEISGVAMLVK